MKAVADTGTPGALERLFKFKQWGTSLKRDTLAGLTTFIVMSYIIFVNPSILGLEGEGLPFAAALTSTCLVAGVMTIVMGLFTNRAYAIAPGMGLNAVVAFSLVQGQGLTFASAMGLVVVEGIAITVLVLGGGGTPLSLGTFVGVPVAVTIFGLLITIIMFTRKWRGAIILGRVTSRRSTGRSSSTRWRPRPVAS